MSSQLRRTRRGSSAISALLIAWLGMARVHAQSSHGEKVELRVSGCEPVFAAEVRRIVRLELGGLLQASSLRDTSANAALEVRCEDELSRVLARDARGDQQVHNTLRFDAFPGDAAPRAVALAAVEALRAVDPTLTARIEAERRAAATEASSPPPDSKPPVRQVRMRSGDPVRAVRPRVWTHVLAGPVVRRFLTDPHTTVWGVRAELSRSSHVPLDYGFDLEGALSERIVDLGAVDVRLVSSAAWMGWRAGSADWSFTTGGGARLGIANLEGSSSVSTVQAEETTRFWAGPFALVRGSAGLGAFSLAVALEAGWAVAGAEGLSKQAAVVGVRGAWLALSLSPGVRF